MRFGTKLVVAAGLLMMAAFYAWVSTGTATPRVQRRSRPDGPVRHRHGLHKRAATEAIMGVVPAEKAGVGSAVNDTTRLLGGTLGVALIGSVYASLYGSRLSTAAAAALPTSLAGTAHSSAGAALIVAQHLQRAGETTLGGEPEPRHEHGVLPRLQRRQPPCRRSGGAGVLMA